MILIVLLGAGFAVGLVCTSLLRHARGRLLVAVAAIAAWAAYAIYIAAIAPCPDEGECDHGIGIIFFAAALVGWLLGVGVSWLVRRPEPRHSSG